MAAPSTLHRSLELAGTLPALMVAADRVAATVIQGVHGRRRVGQGDAFWQYRPYRDGDSASQALMLASRAKALLDGRLAPSVDDVVALAGPILRHRMAVNFSARAEGVTIEAVIAQMCARLA